MATAASISSRLSGLSGCGGGAGSSTGVSARAGLDILVILSGSAEMQGLPVVAVRIAAVRAEATRGGVAIDRCSMILVDLVVQQAEDAALQGDELRLQDQ